jgi:hypothetical protein
MYGVKNGKNRLFKMQGDKVYLQEIFLTLTLQRLKPRRYGAPVAIVL